MMGIAKAWKVIFALGKVALRELSLPELAPANGFSSELPFLSCSPISSHANANGFGPGHQTVLKG